MSKFFLTRKGPALLAIAQLDLSDGMPGDAIEYLDKALEKRRLGEGQISDEEARLACARVSPDQRDMCVFDVLSTNDKDIAGSY